MVDHTRRIASYASVVGPVPRMDRLNAKHANALRGLRYQDAIVGHETRCAELRFRRRSPVYLEWGVSLVNRASGRDHFIHIDGFIAKVEGHDLWRH